MKQNIFCEVTNEKLLVSSILMILKVLLNTRMMWMIFNWYIPPGIKRRGDVVTTSLCRCQRRLRYVPNEKPNDVSMESFQEVSVVCLHNALLERRNDVSKGRLHDVSNKSQMKHLATSQRYVTKTSQWYVSATSH